MKLALQGKPVDARRLFLLIVLPAALYLAAAAFFLPSGFVRTAAFGLLLLPLCFIAFDRPVILLYALVLILFSNLDLFAPFRIYRIILVLFAGAFALAVAGGRRLVWHHPAMLALFGAFALLLFQSISVARDYDSALDQTVGYFKSLLIVMLALQFVRDRGEFRRYALAIAAGILVTALGPLVVKPPTRLASLSLLWEEGVFRYEGFVFEPNQFAMMLLMLVPLLIYLLAAYRRSVFAVFLFSMATLTSVVMLVLSFSRGGFIGLAVLFLALIIVERRNRAVVAVGVSLIAAGIALSPGVYWQRIQSMIAFAQGSRFDLAIFTRIEAMREAVRIGVSHPFLGVGVDNFIFALGSSLPYRMIVHNTFLQVFAELGALAFVVFIAIIVHNFALIGGLMRRRDPEAAQLGRMLLVQQIAVFTSALFIPVAYDYFFWCFLALPAMADYGYRDRSAAAVP